MSNHTPVPWGCSNEGWGDGMADVRGPNGENVCRIPIFSDCPSGDGEQIDSEFFYADRALILAAPDLLEALELVLSQIGGWGADTSPLDKARAAIAKARGEA